MTTSAFQKNILKKKKRTRKLTFDLALSFSEMDSASKKFNHLESK